MIIGDYKWSYEKFTWTFEPLEKSPVIVSVPHGQGFYANDLFGFLEPRIEGVRGCDVNIWLIVKDIMLESQVNVVRGFFPRNFIDYNRPLYKSDYGSLALDNTKLQELYIFYHHSIERILSKMIEVFGSQSCLLIDIHGFTKQPEYGEYDLIFGTGNKTTIYSEIDKKFARFLSERGYKIFLPSKRAIGASIDRYNGGFTVREYSKEFGIDTIQIEVAKKFRVREGKEIGQKLSADLAEFLSKYFNLQKI